MPVHEANVKPNQPWDEDGTAIVTPLPPYPILRPFELPLEHKEGGPVTVRRSEYPDGLVIIPTNSIPFGDSVILPMVTSSNDIIEISDGEHKEWPNGIVVRFIS